MIYLRPGALKCRLVGIAVAPGWASSPGAVPVAVLERPMVEPDSEPEPSSAACAAAVQRATTRHAAQYRDDPAQRLSVAAIAERVTGVPARPTRGRDGWWCVGLIQDTIADMELAVWYREAAPGRARGLGLSERPRSDAPPAAPSFSRFYNDGQHGWIDTETGQGASLAEVRRALGVGEPPAARQTRQVPIVGTWRQYEAWQRARHPEAPE